MHVYKMVYVEREYFKEKDYDYLKDLGIIWETDYGVTEILTENVNDLLENELDKTDSTRVIEILRNSLGKEVLDAVTNNEIDMMLVVY